MTNTIEHFNNIKDQSDDEHNNDNDKNFINNSDSDKSDTDLNNF